MDTIMDKKLIEEIGRLYRKKESDYSLLENWFSFFERKEIPDNTPEEIERDKMNFSFYRGKYIGKTGFVLLDKSWISELATWIGRRKVLEIMAGSGALSVALEREGVNVVATTDDFSWEREFSQWKEVEHLSAIESIGKYSDVDIIICSWPPYNDEAATNALLAMREVNPNALFLYIGEDWGGRTASDSFFETFEEIEDEELDKICIPTWSEIHDRLMLLK